VVDVVHSLELLPVLDFFIGLLGVHLLDREVHEMRFGKLFLVVEHPRVLEHGGRANLILQLVQHVPHVQVVLGLQHANELVAKNDAETLHRLHEVLIFVGDALEERAHLILAALLL